MYNCGKESTTIYIEVLIYTQSFTDIRLCDIDACVYCIHNTLPFPRRSGQLYILAKKKEKGAKQLPECKTRR